MVNFFSYCKILFYCINSWSWPYSRVLGNVIISCLVLGQIPLQRAMKPSRWQGYWASASAACCGQTAIAQTPPSSLKAQNCWKKPRHSKEQLQVHSCCWSWKSRTGTNRKKAPITWQLKVLCESHTCHGGYPICQTLSNMFAKLSCQDELYWLQVVSTEQHPWTVPPLPRLSPPSMGCRAQVWVVATSCTQLLGDFPFPLTGKVPHLSKQAAPHVVSSSLP